MFDDLQWRVHREVDFVHTNDGNLERRDWRDVRLLEHALQVATELVAVVATLDASLGQKPGDPLVDARAEAGLGGQRMLRQEHQRHDVGEAGFLEEPEELLVGSEDVFEAGQVGEIEDHEVLTICCGEGRI